jgi:hypothetical protein
VLRQTFCPYFFCAAKDGRDELSRFVRRRSGRTLLLFRLATFGHLFGTANQETGINAQCPADQAEHNDCADAEAAGTTRSHVATIFNAMASR